MKKKNIWCNMFGHSSMIMNISNDKKRKIADVCMRCDYYKVIK